MTSLNNLISTALLAVPAAASCRPFSALCPLLPPATAHVTAVRIVCVNDCMIYCRKSQVILITVLFAWCIKRSTFEQLRNGWHVITSTVHRICLKRMA